MTLALALLEKIAALFLCLLAGFLLVRLKVLKADMGKAISALLLYALVPCAVLKAFQVENTPQVQSQLFLAFGAAIVSQVLLLLPSSLIRKTLHTDTVEHMSIIYSNAGNIIIPLIIGALGEQYVIYTVAYISVQLVFLWTHCRAAMEGRGMPHGKQALLNTAKQVLLTPSILAILLGLVLFFTGVRLPGPVNDGVDMMGSMIGPASMVITGMLLGGMTMKKVLSYRRVWLIAGMRLVIVPLLTLAVLAFGGRLLDSGEARRVLFIVFLATSSPAASTVTNMSQLYDRDADYAGVINVVTTLLCIITMPLLALLYSAAGNLPVN